MRSALAFVLVSAVAYVVLVAALLAITFAQGGGISCDSDCPPIQDLMYEAAPFPLISGIAISLRPAFLPPCG